MIENLIFFEEEEYANAKRIHSLERTVDALTVQLNTALQEIASLRHQLYDHLNFQHDIESQSRFHITHIPRTQTTDDTSSSESMLIDI